MLKILDFYTTWFEPLDNFFYYFFIFVNVYF